MRGRRNPAFERYCREQDGLEQFATFSALTERLGAGWHQWPSEMRHPASPAVARAATEPALADRIQFHPWTQYQIDRQLERAAAALPVMQDLPIGFDAGGADGWAFQDVLANGISVGAPPDEFNTRAGLGLPPFVPDKLRAAGYGPFAQTIRACLRHAGGLRIDHAMGFFRLFWIPVGAEPKEGVYVRNHAADLLAIVALESQRARAVIVGEDLGTVEADVHEQLASKQILSYRLLWFENGPPSRYPEGALAAVTTHDLPTIAGLWSGSDLEAQTRLGLSPNEAGTARIRSASEADDARDRAHARGRRDRAGARGARPGPIAYGHGHIGRCHGGGGTAEHAGDHRRMAQLASRAAAADRSAGEEPPRGAARARAGQTRGAEERGAPE